MSSREHTKALLAYLRDAPDLASIVFDGAVDGQAPPRYVLVFSQSMDHEVDRMAGRQRPLVARHTIHCIGSVPDEAQWLADKVSTRLVGARIPVPGRSSSPVKHTGGDPMRLDSSVPPAVYFLADDYEWASGP
ncbi:hypothetical protein [Agrococcus sp. DT81.2]|uniref:hypothetical protein n=1 Tax=Agrococcus sp. DT81.2 TaxID=3393414 RepID=UPI003CE4AC55